MQTVKEALTALQKEPGLINYHSTEPFICLTVAEINIIVSLLSQSAGSCGQSEGVEEDIEAARKFRDYFYENLSEHHNPVVAGYLAGRQHVRQQLSQQQQQRSYSKEDMKEAYSHGIDVEAGYSRIFSFDEWLTKYLSK